MLLSVVHGLESWQLGDRPGVSVRDDAYVAVPSHELAAKRERDIQVARFGVSPLEPTT